MLSICCGLWVLKTGLWPLAMLLTYYVFYLLIYILPMIQKFIRLILQIMLAGPGDRAPIGLQ